MLSATVPLTIPSIDFRGRHWPSSELVGLAGEWRGALADRLAGSPRPIALVLENHPLSVALFFALSSFGVPLILLAPDPQAWHSSPPVPPGTPLVLPPALGRLAAAGEGAGLQVSVLPEPERLAAGGHGAPAFLTAPGLVSFTSGSTGAPRPVYRTTANLLGEAVAIAGVFGLAPGDGVVGALPLFRLHGLKQSLLIATVLGSTLGLVERFDHQAVLALFATEKYRYWPSSPVMAEILGRCALSRPVVAPRVCTVATGGLPRGAWDAFRERFAVPLRGLFGTTESGEVTADGAPDERVRPGTVGRPLPGVQVLVGDDPDTPLPPGEVGRLWVKSPWYMHGYGFPPEVTLEGDRGGWMATQDRAQLDAEQYLTISGRLDDHVKTRAGYLVDPGEVAAALRGSPEVTDVAVVPVSTPTGLAIGALVECAAPASEAEIWRRASLQLPVSSRPQVLKVIDALPRLPGGKIDRRRCIEILEGSRRKEGA